MAVINYLDVFELRAGDKVVFYAGGGYPTERESAKTKLSIGHEYTISSVEIGDWSTHITLVEVPGKYFNSCLFGLKGE